MDEHNLYFARSAIIGYLSVETWRVKAELMIITILHIIIITATILNLGFKTFAPKILAHTKCINRYWKYTQIFAAKSRQNLLQKTGKTYCEIELDRTNCKIIRYWRLPKLLIYTQNIRFQLKCMRTSQNICAYQNICFQSKYMRTSWNICAYPKYLLTCKIFAYI